MRAMCAKIQRGILTASAQITRRAALCETSLIKAPSRVKPLGVEFYSLEMQRAASQAQNLIR